MNMIKAKGSKINTSSEFGPCQIEIYLYGLSSEDNKM